MKLLVLALVLGTACFGCRRESATATVASGQREAKVTRGDLADRTLLTGELRAASAIDMIVPKTEVWQLTIRWMAEDGTTVKAGEKVLEFDNSAFTQGLLEKRLQLLEAQSSFRAFKDLATMNSAVKEFELQQHRVALDKAKLMASVPPDLMPQRTAQERQLDQARAQNAVQKADSDLATDRKASGLEARVKQIELEKVERAIEAAERNIANLTLAAARDGVILVGTHPWEGRRFQIGDTVQPGFTIVTLPDLTLPMRVQAELSDVDDGQVTAGMKGTCTLDAYPREPIPCVVAELAPVARTNNRESLRRAFAVGLALERSDPDRMRPGMSVKIELPHPPIKGGLLVPRGAVVVVGKQARVRMANNDLREVTLGACDAQRCAIDTGVTEGELVLEGGAVKLVVVLACATVVACGSKHGDLQLVDIKRGDLVVGVVVTGELAAVDSTDIKPPAVGMWNFKIASMAPDGVEVKQGDPVVGFDTSEQARELATMMNEVESAKKKLEKKRDDAALARREEDLAIANAEAALRKAALKTTTPGELVASVELKALVLDEKAAQIGVELAKNKANQARRSDEAELASLRDRLTYNSDRVAQLQKNLAKMSVTAPRDGTVIYPTSWRGEKKKVGDSAWRMEVVVQVVGLDKMIGKGAVDEVDISRVAKAQIVTLQLDALPDVQIRGKVESLARSVREKSNVDPSKVVELKIALDPTKAPLRPGMRFRGEVESERIANVVLIPTDAVFVTPEGPVAYRARDGSVERIRLELGRRSATMIEVKSGLDPGDRVSRNDPDRRAK